MEELGALLLLSSDDAFGGSVSIVGDVVQIDGNRPEALAVDATEGSDGVLGIG